MLAVRTVQKVQKVRAVRMAVRERSEPHGLMVRLALGAHKDAVVGDMEKGMGSRAGVVVPKPRGLLMVMDKMVAGYLTVVVVVVIEGGRRHGMMARA